MRLNEIVSYFSHDYLLDYTVFSTFNVFKDKKINNFLIG